MKNLFRTLILALALPFAQYAQAQVPILNSYPSAQAVIFLDFDGHKVSGTSWNFSGDILCGGSGLTTDAITTVFNRVAEDYRPFNVNITTDSTKFLAAPLAKRMRVILTVTSAWYGNAGGVSFVNSFVWGDDTPCFVFTALLNYNQKNIAEAASHEAGHTLGLFHQATYDVNCVKTSDYNYGTGSGEIGWAPIMGVGYYQNLTLWNNGPNSYGCANLQSDLDIITLNNGFSFRTDDYGSSFTGTTTLPFTNNQFNVSGVIERSTDQDLFKFTIPAGGGRFRLNATPYNVGTGNSGSDLDMQVSLYNSAQTLLNVFNPGNLLNSVVDTALLTAGTYYIKVEGKGNIYAPNYASLGSYSLQGTFGNGGTLAVRKVELSGALQGDKHQLNWDIDADEQVVKQIIEVSTDGRNFSPVTEPTSTARTFLYRPYVTTTAQYRLNVTFDNGRQVYSNIVTLRNTSTVDRPKLVSNLINTNMVTVTSPGAFNYNVVDFSGRSVSKGQLVNGLNNISIPVMSAGMYIIQFNNTSGQWTDKLLRQ